MFRSSCRAVCEPLIRLAAGPSQYILSLPRPKPGPHIAHNDAISLENCIFFRWCYLTVTPNLGTWPSEAHGGTQAGHNYNSYTHRASGKLCLSKPTRAPPNRETKPFEPCNLTYHRGLDNYKYMVPICHLALVSYESETTQKSTRYSRRLLLRFIAQH